MGGYEYKYTFHIYLYAMFHPVISLFSGEDFSRPGGRGQVGGLQMDWVRIKVGVVSKPYLSCAGRLSCET